jgi:DNA-binding transcriptional ArsR family regulator
MVEYNVKLDAVFSSLADPTRRDILRRVSQKELSINEIARSYQQQMSLAAISKHIQVLEKAHLVQKRRVGKQQFIAPSPPALRDASKYLERYNKLWESRLDRLETFLESTK